MTPTLPPALASTWQRHVPESVSSVHQVTAFHTPGASCEQTGRIGAGVHWTYSGWYIVARQCHLRWNICFTQSFKVKTGSLSRLHHPCKIFWWTLLECNGQSIVAFALGLLANIILEQFKPISENPVLRSHAWQNSRQAVHQLGANQRLQGLHLGMAFPGITRC